MYDYVIVTHIPAFYKINLYNELAKKLKILIIFIAFDTSEKRADDFITLEELEFEYNVLFNGSFQDRNAFKNISQLNQILKNIKYKKLLVSGWDLKEFWYLVLSNSKFKNCLALESTILESNANGIKGFIKKIFLNKISTVFASGTLHVKLLNKLKYKDKVNITKGVGIINKPNLMQQDRIYKKRFLFIGRLSKVKNIELLVRVFNELQGYKLTVIGIGEDEKYLQSISNSNVVFVGAVQNNSIEKYFIENDIFILPSISEPWGLVTEEALYFGLPVMISQNCGSVELIKDGVNGFVINPYDRGELKKIILNIDNEKYKKLLDGVDKFSIQNKDNNQVEVYL